MLSKVLSAGRKYFRELHYYHEMYEKRIGAFVVFLRYVGFKPTAGRAP